MARVKKKSYENLTDANIERVIALLNPTDSSTKAITKKEACEILNIAYNTTRLTKVLEDYKERKDFIAKRKADNRGKAATEREIQEVVTDYLRGYSIAEISKGLYRSSGFVKRIIERLGVPQRLSPSEGVEFLPENCCAESFDTKEIVWSAQHHAPAVVEKEVSNIDYEAKYGAKCYAIYVQQTSADSDDKWAIVEQGGFYAYAAAYDLGKLSHLEKYGVNLEKIS